MSNDLTNDQKLREVAYRLALETSPAYPNGCFRGATAGLQWAQVIYEFLNNTPQGDLTFYGPGFSWNTISWNEFHETYKR